MANVIDLSIANNMPDGTYKTTLRNLTTGAIVHNDDVTYSGGAFQLTLASTAVNDYITGIVISNEIPPVSFAPILNQVFNKISEGIPVDGSLNIVFMGASIMDLTYSSDEDKADGATQIYKNGVYAKVYNRAASGNTSAQTLARVPAVLAEFAGQEANTFIFVHTGGNDISSAGAYPAAAATIEANYRQILEDIIAAGFHAVGASLSDRFDPYPFDIVPYNKNVFEPLIQELTPAFWDDETSLPVVDLWQVVNDYGPTGIEDDGIHPNEIGQAFNRIGIAEGFSSKIDQSNAPEGGIQDLVLTIGSRDNPDIPNWLDGNQFIPSVYMPVNVDGNDAISAFLSTEVTTNSADNGRGNPGDTSQSLTNDLLLSSYMFDTSDEGKVIDIDVGYGQYEDTFTVSCTASRIATPAAYTEVTVGGVTQVLNTAALIPEIITFTGVTGQQLLDDGIQWNRQAGTATGYFSGVRVTKE